MCIDLRSLLGSVNYVLSTIIMSDFSMPNTKYVYLNSLG